MVLRVLVYEIGRSKWCVEDEVEGLIGGKVKNTRLRASRFFKSREATIRHKIYEGE